MGYRPTAGQELLHRHMTDPLTAAQQALERGATAIEVAEKYTEAAFMADQVADLRALLEAFDPETAEVAIARGLRKIQPGKTAHKRIRDRVMASQSPELEDPETPAALLTTRLTGHLKINPTQWLWDRRIPLRHVTYLFGRGGTGKSTLMLDLCARVTRGGEWPDGAPGEVGSVLYIDTENGPETVDFRLGGMGADVDRFHYVDATSERFLLTEVAVLEKTVLAHNVRLVVIDPESSFMAGEDANSATIMRPIIDGLNRVARRTNCAIVIITHTRKGSADTAADAMAGSSQKIAGVRAAIGVAPDMNGIEENRMVIGWTKFNLGPRPSTLGYRLREGSADNLRVEWFTDCTVDADMMYMEHVRVSESKLSTAMQWLHGQLHDGPMLAREIESRAGQEGIPSRTLLTAAQELRVTKRSGQHGQPAVWSLDRGSSFDEPRFAPEDEQIDGVPF